MLQSKSPVNEKLHQSKKFPLWLAIIGLIFVVGSLVAQETDLSKNADEGAENDSVEKTDSDVSDNEEESETEASNNDAKVSSSNSSDQETTADQAIVSEKVEESESNQADQESEEKVETGSYLPNKDKTVIVEVIKGRGVETLYDQIERLGRFK